jgi:hypothetical protein
MGVGESFFGDDVGAGAAHVKCDLAVDSLVDANGHTGAAAREGRGCAATRRPPPWRKNLFTSWSGGTRRVERAHPRRQGPAPPVGVPFFLARPETPGHASHMPQPPQPPSHQVGPKRADAEPLLQRLCRDAVTAAKASQRVAQPLRRGRLPRDSRKKRKKSSDLFRCTAVEP